MRLIASLLVAALLARQRRPAAGRWRRHAPRAADVDRCAGLLVADGAAGAGPGMTVAEALTHGPTDDLVTVTGALFVDADGTVRLCDAIAESFPPQCGGDRIVVEGLDLDDVDGLQEENGVRWAESCHTVRLGRVGDDPHRRGAVRERTPVGAATAIDHSTACSRAPRRSSSPASS